MNIPFNAADQRVQATFPVLLAALGDPLTDAGTFEAAIVTHRQQIVDLAKACRQTPPWQTKGEAMARDLMARFQTEVPEAPCVAGFLFILEHREKEAMGFAPQNAGDFAVRIALPVIADLLRTRH